MNNYKSSYSKFLFIYITTYKYIKTNKIYSLEIVITLLFLYMLRINILPHHESGQIIFTLIKDDDGV